MEASMPDSNRNTLRSDQPHNERNRQPKVDGAHGDQASVEGESAEEARTDAEHTFGKTSKHDS
jgi:hypothetical protein